METNILLADDHSIIRKGLKLLIQLSLGHKNVQEVTSCNELMKELVKKRYTHLVLDLILSDGNTLEIIETIRNLYPDLNIMIFSMQPAVVYGEAVKQYNIHYYLSKTAGEEEIQEFLHKFLRNELPVSKKYGSGNPENPFSKLSPRELEILHYLLKGIGTKEISEILNFKMSTVSTLKNRIFEKTNSGNIKELLELATLYNVNF